MTKTKSFKIPKQLVWNAYLKVKANRGAAGIDQESLEAFDKARNKRLYKIWNRMSSGSYLVLSHLQRVNLKFPFFCKFCIFFKQLKNKIVDKYFDCFQSARVDFSLTS